MKSFFSLLGFLVLSSTLHGQAVPPALMIQQDGRSVPLGLAKLQTEVRVVGAIAETTVTMTFTNPLGRIMEGHLYFPLPEGATISSYALDIDGPMVDGVAVEKDEARRVFEELERRRIDPGLVEWTKPNTFQARVFPIPAHGSRRIRVGYVSELTRDPHGATYRLALPLKNKFPEFSLRIEVVRRSVPPRMTKGNLHRFTFAKWRSSFVAEATLHDWRPEEDVVISLPRIDHPQVAVERADDGHCYFAIDAEPDAPWKDQPPAPVKRVVVFWDASGSRAGDHRREIALLGRILGARMPSNASHTGTIAVELVLVRNAASKPLRLRYSKTAIARALDDVTYDGGTQLGAVGPLPGPEKPDLYLLFSDGRSTFGRAEPARLDAPLEVFSTSAKARHEWLRSLAEANGGHYFDLSEQSDGAVLASLSRPSWAFLSLAVNGGEATDVYPRLPRPSAERILLAGKLTADDATVTLRYGAPGGDAAEQSFTISAADAVEGSLLRRLWAQKQLAELMLHTRQNRDEIIALGQEFGLVTPFTSLMVLDSLEQYVQYRVPPPKSLPAMREQYAQRVGTLDSPRRHEQAQSSRAYEEAQKQRALVQTRREQANQMVELVRLWEQRVQWWESKFKYRPGVKDSSDSSATSKPSRWTGRTPVTGPGYSQMGSMARGAGGFSGSGAGGFLGGNGAGGFAGGNNAAGGFGGMGGVGGFGGGMGGMPAATPTRSVLTPRSGVARRDVSQGAAALPDVPADVSTGDLREPWEGDRAGAPTQAAVQAWNPDAACLKALAEAKKGKADLWTVYLKYRAQFRNSPAFFFEFSDRFRDAGNAELAVQVLSNVAELELDDATLLRAMGYRLLQLEQTDPAVWSFERVFELRPEEPASCRDLANALARRADETARERPHSKKAARADYARAIDLFVRMFQSHSNGGPAAIDLIALEEVNQIIPKAKAAGVSPIRLSPRLVRPLDMDIRIVITWQVDGANVDPAITEPSGEIAYDRHNLTAIGGSVSLYSGQGYGLEEYAIRKAPTGKYAIAANYYGAGTTQLLGATTVQADVFTNYGRPNQRHKSLIFRVQPSQKPISLGDLDLRASGLPTFQMPRN